MLRIRGDPAERELARFAHFSSGLRAARPREPRSSSIHVRALPGLLLTLAAAVPLGARAEDGYRPSGERPAEMTYVFGIHPYTNPQDLFAAYEPIMPYLDRKVPGARFSVEGSRDYADFEAKLAARRFHFALPNPAQTVASLGQGYRVIAKMKPDDDFRGRIIARAGSAVASPRDFAGKALCFPSASAVAGTMLPLLFLHERGLDVKKGIEIRYVGSQFSSIVNATTGEFAACGSTSRFWRTWSRENPEKARGLRVLWRTQSLPHNGVVARQDVPLTLARRWPRPWWGWTRTLRDPHGNYAVSLQLLLRAQPVGV
jgi:phosphonate transport system substrate-binding protein